MLQLYAAHQREVKTSSQLSFDDCFLTEQELLLKRYIIKLSCL